MNENNSISPKTHNIENDIAEDSFISKLPRPLRYLLFIPASIIGSVLFSIIYTWLLDSFTLNFHIINVLVLLLGTGVMGVAFVYIAAYVVPKFQLQVAYFTLVIGTIGASILWSVLLASGAFHALHSSAYYTLFFVVAILGAIMGFGIVYEKKHEKLPVASIVVGVILLVGSVTYFGTKTFSSNQTAFSVNNVAPYISNADGFQINFPIKPTVTTNSQSTSYGTVHLTGYDCYNTGGTEQYSVDVIKYPLSYGNYSQYSQSQQIAEMKSAINNSAKGISGEKVLSMTPVDFESQTAVEGQLSINGKFNEKITGYVVDFETGQTEYSIFSAGVGQSNFNQFANSFKLL